MTIIWFTRPLPDPIADELQRQGHAVFGSLSISETGSVALIAGKGVSVVYVS